MENIKLYLVGQMNELRELMESLEYREENEITISWYRGGIHQVLLILEKLLEEEKHEQK